MTGSHATDAVAYFDAVQAAAQAAPAPTIVHHYCIGGFPVDICGSNPALLAELTRALAHLATAPADRVPWLTIQVWDGAPRPPAPWTWRGQPAPDEHFDPERVLSGLNSDRIYTGLDLYPSRLHLLDRARNRGALWIESADDLPYYEAGAPFRRLLGSWMAMQGRHFMHAGAVGIATGAVLLAGPSGVGKSTAALACLDSALSYLGDDYVLVATAPAPWVYSLYNTAKLKGAEDLRRIPDLAPQVHNAARLDREKAMIFVHKHWPDKLAGDVPLRALLVPRVTGVARARLAPIPAAHALAACAPSTLTQLRLRSQATLQHMAELVRRLPCYRLEMGPDLAGIPAAILDLLSD